MIAQAPHEVDLCNRYKGTDIASIDRSGHTVRFFDPRRDAWEEHFQLHGPIIQPLTFSTSTRSSEQQVVDALNVRPVLD